MTSAIRGNMDGASAPEYWSSERAFLFAAIGGSVGLGNIWRFPYETGQNGGAAFVIVYLACVFLISLPILICELTIGRKTGYSAMSALKLATKQSGGAQAWRYSGWLMVATLFLVASFYSVIGGWTLRYMGLALQGGVAGLNAEVSASYLSDFLASPVELTFWHFFFSVLCVLVLARGVTEGLEKVASKALPVLFFLLAAMVISSFFLGDMASAINFLFKPDFSKINADVFLSALGQAFFSVGIGMGFMITFGAYLPKKISIGKSALVIVAGDTLVSIVAGLAIFPFVFGHGLDPSAGEGLVFETLPVALGSLPGANIFAFGFFLLFTIAALTSQLALLEPMIAGLSERAGIGRKLSTIIVGCATFIFGIGTVLSFNLWADVKLFGETFFGLSDKIVTQITMPLGALMVTVFVGWVMKNEATSKTEQSAGHWFKSWRLLVRYLCPVAVGAIFLYQFAA